MKTVIIYYSLKGNCAFAAQTLVELLGGAHIYEIKPVDAKERRGLARYWWCGRQILLGEKPAVWPLAIDLDIYDRIILGAPVWAGLPAPPMAAFLEQMPLSGRVVALYCCHAGIKGLAPAKFRALLAGNIIAGELDLINPAAHPEKARRALETWAKVLGS
jgi:flavodoxin